MYCLVVYEDPGCISPIQCVYGPFKTEQEANDFAANNSIDGAKYFSLVPF